MNTLTNVTARTKQTPRRPGLAWAVLLAAGLMLPLGAVGCDGGGSPGVQAIEKASDALSAMAASGLLPRGDAEAESVASKARAGEAPSTEGLRTVLSSSAALHQAQSAEARKRLTEVAKLLAEPARSEDKGISQPASLLLGRAQGELATLDLLEAVALERESISRTSVARRSLDAFLGVKASADASGRFSVDGAIEAANGRLSRVKAEGEALRGELAAAKSDAEKAIATIEKLRSDRLAKREAIAQLMSTARSETEKLAKQREAAALGKEIDVLEQDEVRAQAAAEEATRKVRELAGGPEARPLEAKLGEKLADDPTDNEPGGRLAANAREEALTQAGLTDLGRLKAGTAESQAASAALASELGAALGKSISGLKELRAGPLAMKSKAAEDGLKAALATLQKAGTGQGPAKQLEAAFNIRHGDLLLARARGTQLFAELLREAAKAGVPGASEAEADGADKVSKDLLAEARGAYSAAKAGFEGIPGATAVKDNAARQAAILDQLITGDVKKDPAGSSSPAPAGGPAAAAPGGRGPAPAASGDAAPVGPEAEIRAFLERLIDAGKRDDSAAQLAMFHADGPLGQPLLGALRPLATASANLSRATRAKFGKSLNQIMTDHPEITGGSPTSSLSIGIKSDSTTAAQMQVSPAADGRTATVTEPGAAEPMKLRKIGAEWKVDLDAMIMASLPPEMAADPAAAAAMAGPMMSMVSGLTTKLSGSFSSLAQRVNSGELATEPTFVEALKKAYTEAMMGMMPGMGDSGMGGGVPSGPGAVRPGGPPRPQIPRQPALPPDLEPK